MTSPLLVRFVGLSFLALLFCPSWHMLAISSQQKLEWISDASVSGVEFYHAIQPCGEKNAVFLKLINKNGFKVNVTWKELFTTQAPDPVEGFAGQKKLALSPGEVSETNCEHPARKELLTLSSQVSPAYNADIQKFSFKDITVSRSN